MLFLVKKKPIADVVTPYPIDRVFDLLWQSIKNLMPLLAPNFPTTRRY